MRYTLETRSDIPAHSAVWGQHDNERNFVCFLTTLEFTSQFSSIIYQYIISIQTNRQLHAIQCAATNLIRNMEINYYGHLHF